MLDKIWQVLNWKPFEPMLEQLCVDLSVMGVQAKLTEHAPPNNKFRVLDISGSPIGWISMKIPMSGDEEIVVEFGIPDLRHIPLIVIQAKQTLTVPIFGRVVGISWEGDDKNTGIMQLLTSDDTIKTSIMDTCEVKVTSRPDQGYWLIAQKRWSLNSPMYKVHQWKCYEKIAKILLTTPVSE